MSRIRFTPEYVLPGTAIRLGQLKKSQIFDALHRDFPKGAQVLAGACHGSESVGRLLELADRIILQHELGDPNASDYSRLTNDWMPVIAKESAGGKHLIPIGGVDPTQILPAVPGSWSLVDSEHNETEAARLAFQETSEGKTWVSALSEAFSALHQSARGGLDFPSYVRRVFGESRPDKKVEQAKKAAEESAKEAARAQANELAKAKLVFAVKQKLRAAGIDPSIHRRFLRQNADKIPASATAEQIAEFAAAKESE